MMRAVTGESIVPESGKEKRLWKERALLEVQIKKEKMIGNTRARLKADFGVQGRQELENEANEIKREIDKLREEVTTVDREIQAVEKEMSKEVEEAATKESKARQE